jgi:hypothetical protein
MNFGNYANYSIACRLSTRLRCSWFGIVFFHDWGICPTFWAAGGDMPKFGENNPRRPSAGGGGRKIFNPSSLNMLLK